MDTTTMGSTGTTGVAVRTRPGALTWTVVVIALALIAAAGLWVGLGGSNPARTTTGRVEPAVAVADGSRSARIHQLSVAAVWHLRQTSKPVPICIPCIARSAAISGRLG